MHKQSVDEPDKFWGDAARSTLKWFRDFDRVSQGGFETGDVAWFTGGQLNACYNCVDQHLPQRAKQVGCYFGVLSRSAISRQGRQLFSGMRCNRNLSLGEAWVQGQANDPPPSVWHIYVQHRA